MKKSIISSFIINIIGLVSLFIIDVYISRSSVPNVVASWALTKSILFIGVLFVLMGLDQAIVRMKLKLQELFPMAIMQFLTIIIFMMGTLELFNFNINKLFLSSSLLLLAISYLFYAAYRLEMNYIKSQIFLQGWKIVLLTILIFYGFHSYTLILPISLLLVILFFAFKDIVQTFKLKNFQLDYYLKALHTGSHYFLSLLTLTVSLYFDQLLLNYDTKSIESSQLFTHITYFVSPVVIFLGFAGFIVGPYLRNNPDKKEILFKKYFILYFFIGLLLSFGSYFIGYRLFSYFKTEIEIIDYLSILLMVIVFLRYLYILPSAYIGSFASNKLIRSVSTINLLGLLLYLLSYFTISRVSHKYLLAIVISMVIIWLIRVANGYYAIFKILNTKD